MKKGTWPTWPTFFDVRGEALARFWWASKIDPPFLMATLIELDQVGQLCQLFFDVRNEAFGEVLVVLEDSTHTTTFSRQSNR